MQLSIIIVNYNVRDLLLNAIASLNRALSGIEGEIIVVDNASSDGAVELLQRDYPEVLTLPQDRNLGFGRAHNIGISHARGEYILILNPDTVVQEDTLREMLQFMADHPNAGAVGCKIVHPDGTLDAAAKRGFPSPWSAFSRVFGLSRLFPRSKLFGGYNLSWIGDDTTSQVESLSGSFMFFRASVLRELGGFDTDFFMYGEDLDLCWRTRKGGWEVWYYPGTSIIHIKGESTRRSSLDSIGMFYDAMEIFARKHFRSPFLLFLVRLGILLRRGIARIERLFPSLSFAAIDVVAVLVGFIISTLLVIGELHFPNYAVPWVFVAPPTIFILTIAASGGYGVDAGRLSRTLLGYLVGFFILSTLTYFFEGYRFSRGIVLATTGISALIGLTARFLILLYRRTYGRESARRVAVISGGSLSLPLRDRLRETLLGRPVSLVGIIAPTFSQLDKVGEGGIGSIENIARIVREHRLTDVFVIDSEIGYGEAISAMRLCAGESVRFHLMRDARDGGVGGEIMATGSVRHSYAPEPYRQKIPLTKRLTDRLLALTCLLLFPFLTMFGGKGKLTIKGLLQSLIGQRPLVRGAASKSEEPEPVFSAAAVYSDQIHDEKSLVEIERYYEANRSFMLDCEIIVSSLRTPLLSESLGEGVSREVVH
ncbi:MAG: glycosyltransferase [Candidatus Kapaibacterium sp.]